jgi:hypothetical protein
MSSFPLLCERAGTADPIDDFITQASAVLGRIETAKGNGWEQAPPRGQRQRCSDGFFEPAGQPAE